MDAFSPAARPLVSSVCRRRGECPPFLTSKLKLGGEPAILRSRPQDAGAISSLVFRGKEFIAARENGWLLQGAGGYGLFAECLNPTLAGARYDPPESTSSRLLASRADGHVYSTRTQMAFWTPPGRRCSDARGQRRHAVNTTVLSDTFYAQTMTAGFRGVARAIKDEVIITTPRPEPIAGFEVLTGYMPAEFNRFYTFDVEARDLQPIADKELSTKRFEPEVVATNDGRYAMSVLAIAPVESAHYAAFRNVEVSKWSLVYHFNEVLGAGPHHFECVVLIGTRTEVLQSLRSLIATPKPPWLQLAIAGLVVASLLAVALMRGQHAARSALQPLH